MEEQKIGNRLHPLYPVNLIIDKKSHFYQLGDNPDWKPGVTTVLGVLNKPALVQWASNTACENIREYLISNALDKPLTKEQIELACLEGKNIYKKKAQEAANIGTRVHEAINSIISGKEGAIAPDIQPAIDSFKSWDALKTLKIELGDTKIGSRVFGYGGSLDMVAFDGDEAILFDFKTTKKRKDRDHGIYDTYAYQLAAYCVAFRETYGIPVKSAYALWLNKEKPEFKAVKISNIEKCFRGFLACLEIYNLSKHEKFENRENLL